MGQIGLSLKYLNKEMENDQELVYHAVKQNGYSLKLHQKHWDQIRNL